ncbi:MAG TPA: hypothetical protein VG246_13055 [Acidimicrobiales bacterium]|nr:hypothetical protein [Acidimicrobiales bacterium]
MKKPLDAAMMALQEAGRELETLRAEVRRLQIEIWILTPLDLEPMEAAS